METEKVKEFEQLFRELTAPAGEILGIYFTPRDQSLRIDIRGAGAGIAAVKLEIESRFEKFGLRTVVRDVTEL